MDSKKPSAAESSKKPEDTDLSDESQENTEQINLNQSETPESSPSARKKSVFIKPTSEASTSRSSTTPSPSTPRNPSTSQSTSTSLQSSFADSPDPEGFKKAYTEFSTFADKEGDGGITLKNIDKWIGQCDTAMKTDTSTAFSQVAKGEKRLSRQGFEEFIKALAKSEGMEVADFKERLSNAGPPRLSNDTKSITTGSVGKVTDRLTDVVGYTGIHKDRAKSLGAGALRKITAGIRKHEDEDEDEESESADENKESESADENKKSESADENKK